MAEENGLTPQQTGTGESPTPDVGTGAPDATGGEPAPAPPAEKTVPLSRYTASVQEAQRLYQENLRKDGELQALRNYYGQPQRQVQTPVADVGFDDPNLPQDLLDAVLDKKPEVVKKYGRSLIDQSKREMMADLGGYIATAQRIGSSREYIFKELKDPDSPVTQKAWQNYQRMVMDPGEVGSVAQDTMDWGNGKINPHLMKSAIREAKIEIGGKVKSIEKEGRESADGFVEPSRPTVAPKKTAFNPMVHLSADERMYCEKAKIPFKNYWEHLDDPKKPGLREARLKAGKPIAKSEFMRTA